jgi:hypothetical protein
MVSNYWGGAVSRHGIFFRNFTSIKIKSAIQNIKSIMKLEDDQISMRLLENTSGTNKVNHLYRTIHPSYFESTTETLRNELKSSLRTCLTGNSPGFGEFAYIWLPFQTLRGDLGYLILEYWNNMLISLCLLRPRMNNLIYFHSSQRISLRCGSIKK